MSLEEFLALPDIPHQALAFRIGVLLATSLPELVVVHDAGLRTAREVRRIPDLMVLGSEEDAPGPSRHRSSSSR